MLFNIFSVCIQDYIEETSSYLTLAIKIYLYA